MNWPTLQPLPTHHGQGLHGQWLHGGLISFALSSLIIIHSRNAVEHIYHLRLVSERLSEAGMKIKQNDGKQKSMTYLSESEDSEHRLEGGVIQYIYYIFSILVSSLHTGDAYVRHIYVLNFIFIILYIFVVICDCYLELYIYL